MFFEPEEAMSVEELEERLKIKTAAWQDRIIPKALELGGQALYGAGQGAQTGALVGGVMGAKSGIQEGWQQGGGIIDILRSAGASTAEGALKGALYGAGVGAVAEPVIQQLSHYTIPLPGAGAINKALGKQEYAAYSAPRTPGETVEMGTETFRRGKQYGEMLKQQLEQTKLRDEMLGKMKRFVPTMPPSLRRADEVITERVRADLPARIAAGLSAGWLTMRSLGKGIASRKASRAGGDVDTSELKVTEKYWPEKKAAVQIRPLVGSALGGAILGGGVGAGVGGVGGFIGSPGDRWRGAGRGALRGAIPGAVVGALGGAAEEALSSKIDALSEPYRKLDRAAYESIDYNQAPEVVDQLYDKMITERHAQEVAQNLRNHKIPISDQTRDNPIVQQYLDEAASPQHHDAIMQRLPEWSSALADSDFAKQLIPIRRETGSASALGIPAIGGLYGATSAAHQAGAESVQDQQKTAANHGGLRRMWEGVAQTLEEHPTILEELVPEAGLAAASVPAVAVAARSAKDREKTASLILRILGGRHV